jgi:hypothetical protein
VHAQEAWRPEHVLWYLPGEPVHGHVQHTEILAGTQPHRNFSGELVGEELNLLQRRQIPNASWYLAGEIVRREVQIDEVPQPHNGRRDVTDQGAVGGEQHAEVGEVAELLRQWRRRERVVGELELLEGGEVGHECRELAGEVVAGEAEVRESRERGEAGGQRTHEGVQGEVEALQGPQGAERGREPAGEGEPGEVEADDGAGGVLGAGHVLPAARGSVAGARLPAGERAGGVGERGLSGEEELAVGGARRNGVELEQREEQAEGGHGVVWWVGESGECETRGFKGGSAGIGLEGFMVLFLGKESTWKGDVPAPHSYGDPPPKRRWEWIDIWLGIPERCTQDGS